MKRKNNKLKIVKALGVFCAASSLYGNALAKSEAPSGKTGFKGANPTKLSNTLAAADVDPGSVGREMTPQEEEALLRQLMDQIKNEASDDRTFDFGASGGDSMKMTGVMGASSWMMPGLNARDDVGVINLSDEFLPQVFKLLTRLTGMPIIASQNLPQARITYNSARSLDREEAIRALSDVLSVSGVSILKLNDDSLKAVPNGGVSTQAPQMLNTESLEKLIPSEQVYSYSFKFNYLSVNQVAPTLHPLLKPGMSSFIVFEANNSILVTDSLNNLKRIAHIYKEMDRPGEFDHVMKAYQLENADPEEVRAFIENMRQKGLRNYLGLNASFEVNQRTNKLFVLAHPDCMPLIDQIVDELDQEVADKQKSSTIRLKQANAKEVSTIIQEMISNQRQLAESSATPEGLPNAENINKEGGNASHLSRFAGVVADERSNAILATGTRDDLIYIERVVNDLDVVLPQVLLEVVFAEITLEKNHYRGIDLLLGSIGTGSDLSLLVKDKGKYGINLAGFNNSLILKNTKNLPDPVPGQFLTRDASGNVTAATPGNELFQPGSLTLDGIVKRIKDKAHTTILSAPVVSATHNQEAVVMAGEERPIQTTSTRSNESRTELAIEYKPIGLELKVTPLIGDNGVIQLKVSQKLDAVSEQIQISGFNQPVVRTRKSDSFVSVSDEDIVVLSGLQEVQDDITVSKVPVLGYLPVAGNLFTGQTKKKVRKEIMVFIRPKILPNPAEASRVAQEALERQVGKDEIKDVLYKTGGSVIPRDELEQPRSHRGADALTSDSKPRRQPRSLAASKEEKPDVARRSRVASSSEAKPKVMRRKEVAPVAKKPVEKADASARKRAYSRPVVKSESGANRSKRTRDAVVAQKSVQEKASTPNRTRSSAKPAENKTAVNRTKTTVKPAVKSRSSRLEKKANSTADATVQSGRRRSSGTR